METVELQALLDALQSSQLQGIARKIWLYRRSTVVVEFGDEGSPLAMDVSYSTQFGWSVSVLARTKEGQRQLRNLLVGRAELVQQNGERNILAALGHELRTETLVGQVLKWTTWITQQETDWKVFSSPASERGGPYRGVFWWDNRPNFGDAIGPWLVHRITGKTPYVVRGAETSVPPLMSVGSILQLMAANGTQVWGSGLIAPLEGKALSRLRSMSDVRIHAVRGWKTRSELVSKLGWEVPAVVGDPGLLLPRFIAPTGNEASRGKIAFIPHYAHTDKLQGMNSTRVHVVDVRNGLERVAREIASADYCVSTSLHGLIVAQAYGVPWTRLSIEDAPLTGGDFKFTDFYSTLENDDVSHVRVSSEELPKVRIERLAGQARLPRLQVSLNRLESAFPDKLSPVIRRPSGSF
ncbi:polysaccharide pyruvyl transferase family protein [Arthrobacter sp.]|uniref:polysaccharide pyruvyl transferase family protein n=1 Tax=Arthrobacter sp. TaxID=1667 RepID=UPI003A8D415B